MQKTIIAVAFLLTFASCSSKKKLLAVENAKNEIQLQLDKARAALNDCDARTSSLNAELKTKNDQLAANDKSIRDLQDQIEFFKKNNMQLLDRMADLSIVTKEGSESIKKSMETLNLQGRYIQDLNKSIQTKDSLNLVLVQNLKRSLADVSDEDVQVEVRKGVVYVSLSDKMLFRSGSYEINQSAEAVVGKVAKILNDYKQIEILIEGHTDNVPISNESVKDNWDLSVKRATSVARLLQNRYGVEPGRMIAGGRGEYLPKASNSNAKDRQTNRRTEIIITPKLDQYFNLYSNPDSNK